MRPPNTISFPFSLSLTQSICLFLACHSVLLPRLARSQRVINANLRCIHRSGHFEVCQPSTSCCPLPSLSLLRSFSGLSQTSHTQAAALAATTTTFVCHSFSEWASAKQIVGAAFHLCARSTGRLHPFGCPAVRLSGCPVVRPARLPVRVVHSDAKAAAFELCRRRSRKFHQLLRKFSFFSSRFSLCLSLSLFLVFLFY